MIDDTDNSSRQPVDRRGFFRQLLLRGVDSVERAGQRMSQKLARSLDAAEQAAGAASPAGTVARGDVRLRWLRPPGALPEAEFASACSRCGDCVRACPAQCITLSPDVAGGLPHIVARQSPCVVCEDLSCTKTCPTGALELVDSIQHIHMGLAVVAHDRCLRHPRRGGEDCRLCATACPLGDIAIGVDEQGRIDIRPGCTGCGVCERACPTEPASVVVVDDSRLPIAD